MTLELLIKICGRSRRFCQKRGSPGAFPALKCRKALTTAPERSLLSPTFLFLYQLNY